MWVQSLDQEDLLEEGMANPLQYSCLENPHGQRNLGGFSPWAGGVGHDSATKHSTAHSEYS